MDKPSMSITEFLPKRYDVFRRAETINTESPFLEKEQHSSNIQNENMSIDVSSKDLLFEFPVEKIVDSFVNKDEIRYYLVQIHKFWVDESSLTSKYKHLIDEFWKSIHDLEKNDDNISEGETPQSEIESVANEPHVHKMNVIVENDIQHTEVEHPACEKVDITGKSSEPTQENFSYEDTISKSPVVSVADSSVASKDKSAVSTVSSAERSNGNTVTDDSNKCHLCGKILSSKKVLKRHMTLKHLKNGRHQCPTCSKRFISSHELWRHMPVHTNVKLYSCEICTKSFKQSGQLYKHMKIHTGEKKYECEICHRKFSQKNNLETHYYTHKTEKLFQCNICENKFKHKNSVYLHIKRNHSNIKDAACVVINPANQNENVVKEDVLNIIYSCGKCMMNFISQPSLNRHILSNHGNDRDYHNLQKHHENNRDNHNLQKLSKHQNIVNNHLLQNINDGGNEVTITTTKVSDQRKSNSYPEEFASEEKMEPNLNKSNNNVMPSNSDVTSSNNVVMSLTNDVISSNNDVISLNNDVISCKKCSKPFASEQGLSDHFKLQHELRDSVIVDLKSKMCKGIIMNAARNKKNQYDSSRNLPSKITESTTNNLIHFEPVIETKVSGTTNDIIHFEPTIKTRKHRVMESVHSVTIHDNHIIETTKHKVSESTHNDIIQDHKYNDKCSINKSRKHKRTRDNEIKNSIDIHCESCQRPFTKLEDLQLHNKTHCILYGSSTKLVSKVTEPTPNDVIPFEPVIETRKHRVMESVRSVTIHDEHVIETREHKVSKSTHNGIIQDHKYNEKSSIIKTRKQKERQEDEMKDSVNIYCEYCQRPFIKWEDLQIHNRTHCISANLSEIEVKTTSMRTSIKDNALSAFVDTKKDGSGKHADDKQTEIDISRNQIYNNSQKYGTRNNAVCKYSENDSSRDDSVHKHSENESSRNEAIRKHLEKFSGDLCRLQNSEEKEHVPVSINNQNSPNLYREKVASSDTLLCETCQTCYPNQIALIHHLMSEHKSEIVKLRKDTVSDNTVIKATNKYSSCKNINK